MIEAAKTLAAQFPNQMQMHLHLIGRSDQIYYALTNFARSTSDD